MAEEKLELFIQNAVRLHGHLGPFLVIGVRMGIRARKELTSFLDAKSSMHVVVKVPPVTPFSCTVDGIQATTSCTVGNRRLRIRSSRKKIAADFQSRNSTIERNVHISVNPKLVERIATELSEGVANEELAAQIMSMPDEDIFEINEREVSSGL